jgi:hypothetical protein
VQQGVSVQRLLDGLVNRQIAVVEETPASEGALHGVNAGVGERHLVGSGIDGEALFRTEIEDDLAGNASKAAAARLPAGDHERAARLVDQDGVGFVDDGRVKIAVDLLVWPDGYTVAEEVEADLILGGVGRLCRRRRRRVAQRASSPAERARPGGPEGGRRRLSTRRP